MNINLSSEQLLIRLLSTNAAEIMEAAKKIIGLDIPINSAVLSEIASSKLYSLQSRVAAIYILGFTNKKEFSKLLCNILEDSRAHWQIRSHAAEAIGNLRDKNALHVVDAVAKRTKNKDIKISCSYAHSQITKKWRD